MFEAVEFEIIDGIAKIVLNRSDAANSMNLTKAREFARAALICDDDKTVKVVLVTAAGRMFSAGGDLSHASDGALAANVGIGGSRVTPAASAKPIVIIESSDFSRPPAASAHYTPFRTSRPDIWMGCFL